MTKDDVLRRALATTGSVQPTLEGEPTITVTDASGKTIEVHFTP